MELQIMTDAGWIYFKIVLEGNGWVIKAKNGGVVGLDSPEQGLFPTCLAAATHLMACIDEAC